MNLRRTSVGFSMVETLVTIVILMVGLLGLASLQARTTVVESESYERGQALGLLRYMEAVVRGSRLQDNSTNPATYSTPFAGPDWSSPDGSVVFGTGDSYSSCDAVSALPDREVCNWSMALKGVAEQRAGSMAGAMLGARGCLLRVDPPTADNAVAEFQVVVVWAGLSATTQLAADSPGARCAPDVNFGAGLRRAVTTRVLIPSLAG